MAKKKYKINRERVLLTSLIAVAFLGFLLWSIQECLQEEESLILGYAALNNPASNQKIKIASPKPNSMIKNPVMITGQADTAEGALSFRIKDSKGLILATGAAKTSNSQKMSSFSLSLRYKKSTSQKGFIEIFEISKKDQTEIYKLLLPITFAD